MKLKLLSEAILFLFAIIIFSSCGTDMNDEIIGEWKDQNGKVITFSGEGNVKGLARNIKRELVDGTFEIRNDSLFVEFLAAPPPRNIKGILEFHIKKLDKDSLILNTQIGNLNYHKIITVK